MIFHWLIFLQRLMTTSQQIDKTRHPIGQSPYQSVTSLLNIHELGLTHKSVVIHAMSSKFPDITIFVG